MKIIPPTSVKLPPDLKEAAKKYALKKEEGNLSVVIIKSLKKYIKYDLEKKS